MFLFSRETMVKSVQVFGRKKTATAVAYTKEGNGMIKVNGVPIDLLEPSALRYKVLEPVLLLGKKRFEGVDIRIRVRGSSFFQIPSNKLCFDWMSVLLRSGFLHIHDCESSLSFKSWFLSWISFPLILTDLFPRWWSNCPSVRYPTVHL